MGSLAEAIQDEIKRVSSLRDIYLGLPGGVGMIGATMMRVSIDEAVNALAENDIERILLAYEDLKGYQE